jgi:peptide/nickel transport system permease protein
LGSLFGVVIIIEYFYSMPGMGTLFMYAVLQRDYPIIVGGVLVLAIMFVSLNFIIDVLYGILDSRVREW